MNDNENRKFTPKSEPLLVDKEHSQFEQATGTNQNANSLDVSTPLLNATGLYTRTRHIIASPSSFSLQDDPTHASAGVSQRVNADNHADLEEQAAHQAMAFSSGHEELRLDVDGFEPQMTASGTSYTRLTETYHWIAALTKTSINSWGGPIWYKDGNTSKFPFTRVDITVTRQALLHNKAIVKFSGGVQGSIVLFYNWKSSTYRKVDFEFDATEDANPVLSINTHDHPNRPSEIPAQTLNINTIFRRAGFEVTNSDGGGIIPRAAAGTNNTWSDAELHDAMQVYWSRFANTPHWGLWVLSAALHDRGRDLGGTMFHTSGRRQRQGTVVFTESFISDPPTGDPSPVAWVRRMKLWTTAHEMGHAFNLAHSWQKSLGLPWMPLADEPEARSFMNYPYFVAGGQSAFFSNFDYRFSNSELLFMRHAPNRFVQMGNADWFDNHGFNSPDSTETSFDWHLTLRANRDKPSFEFLEPVVLELKLTNISRDPKIVRANTLSFQSIMAIIKQNNKPARQWVPYANYCDEPAAQVLESGNSIYQQLPIYAGINGWDISEPGTYDIQVAVEVDDQIILSAPFKLRVLAPESWDKERVASDFFTEDVGRVLWFSGTKVLRSANDTLHEVVEQLPGTRAAIHAAFALAQPLVKNYKTLDIPDSGIPISSVSGAGGIIRESSPNIEAALDLVQGVAENEVVAESLGHIGYRHQVESMGRALAKADAFEAAVSMQTSLRDTLSSRGVLQSVIDEITLQIDRYSETD